MIFLQALSEELEMMVLVRQNQICRWYKHRLGGFHAVTPLMHALVAKRIRGSTR
jgi:hypothetical protein